MNLNNLRPAWQKFQLSNAMQPIRHEDLLVMLEKADAMAIHKTRFMMCIFMFVMLTICCQGG
jgi:hypothetical protein